MTNGWETVGRKLEKSFTFQDFNAAIQFVNKVAALAEVLQHHPDIQLYDYKYVRIVLFTHSVQQVTEKDLTLAAQIDAIVI